MSTSMSRTCRAVAMALAAVASVGCGGGGGDDGPANTCLAMGTASYAGTEDVNVTSGSCPSYTDLTVTFAVVQASGACTFTLTNSRVVGTTFPGTISGSDLTWSGSYPQASGSVTIDSVDASVTADLSGLNGSFTWTYHGMADCTGTTSFTLLKVM